MKIRDAIRPPETVDVTLKYLGLPARPPVLGAGRRAATPLFEPDPDWSRD